MAEYDPVSDGSRAPDPTLPATASAPAAARPAFSYTDTPNESAAMQGHAPDLVSLYQHYYGTSTPPASDFTANLGNPYGLSNIEAMMKNDPASQAYLKSQAAASQPQPSAAATFSDPASQQWEKILNDTISRLQTPQPNPGFDTAVNQLNQYLARLNGPVYTPDQMSLMQTQAIDPIERQRAATKQQITQRLAAHGVGPGSGILEKALEDADQQFNAMRDATSSRFATNAIGLSNQNAATAAQIAPFLAQLYQGQNGLQDSRAMQAASLAGVIPQAAWERLIQSNGLVTPTDPFSALNQLSAFQGQSYSQNADFANTLTQILPYLLKVFTS